MLAFLKYLRHYWKWTLGGFVLATVLFIGFAVLRVASFVGDTTGGGRTQSLLVSPTADVKGTATAQARYNDLFGSNASPTAGINTTGVSLSPTAQPTATPIPNLPINSKIIDKIKRNEPITTLLVGYAGAGVNTSAYATDSILVLRFDPQSKTITQFNVPRDLWVFVPYGGAGKGNWAKVNTIFSSIMTGQFSQNDLDAKYRSSDDLKKQDAAVNLLADSIEPVLNLKIDYWATINYDGFRKLIDALGGVDIYVERSFVDKQYPKNDDDRVDASVITIEFKAGWQKMDGETAIRYSRSRKSESEEGGDFARSRRQMRVIMALKDKILKENLFLKAFDVMGALQGKIRLSPDLDEITNLARYFQTDEGKKLASEVKIDSELIGNNGDQTFWVETTKPDYGYTLVPVQGQGRYEQVHQWVQRSIANADVRRENVRVQVFNASSKSGVAGKMTDFLLDQGFRLCEPQDAINRDDTVLMDYTNGDASGNIKRLQKILPNLKVVSQTPDKRPPDVAGDLVLYLGKDFKGSVNAASNNNVSAASQPVTPAPGNKPN